MKYAADLHVHSCLSPCAEEDMTPNNIARMAKLAGLEIVALTDHNSCKNCAAFLTACERAGIVGVPGMELTTSEDVHLVCLFPALSDAETFSREIGKRRIRRDNRPEVFGRQILMDADDRVTGEEPSLLLFATGIPIFEAHALCRAHRGACYPAHIDREGNGVLAVLGMMPEEPDFTAVELNRESSGTVRGVEAACRGRRIVYASDAHRLESIPDADAAGAIALPDGLSGAQAVRDALIAALRGETEP